MGDLLVYYAGAHVANLIAWVALACLSVSSLIFTQVDSTQVALALIGAVASVANTWFLTKARREHRDIIARQNELDKAVIDTKAKVGADRREGDE